MKRLPAEGRRGRKSVGRVERAWFLDSIRDATMLSDLWAYGSALVVVREVIGGLVEDGQVAAAMQRPVDWVRRIPGN